jgi:prepilin-type N-terminal cleavage/methylation domain-containing protein
MKNLRNNKGFTLIELMIVVVIIGILAALAIPKFSQTAKSAKKAEADPVLAQLCTLNEVYFERYNKNAAHADSLKQVGYAVPTKVDLFSAYTFVGGSSTTQAEGTATATGTAAVDNVSKEMTCADRKIVEK